MTTDDIDLMNPDGGELDDLSPMPFGKYKGYEMQEVPVKYLHWLWHDSDDRKGPVFDYIRKNIVALKQENEDLIWS